MNGRALLILVIIALATAVVVRILPFQNPFKVPILKKVHLLNVTNQVTSNTVIFPRATTLSLVLGLPLPAPKMLSDHQFEIGIWKKDDLLFSSKYRLQDTQKANWLDHQGLQAFLFEQP